MKREIGNKYLSLVAHFCVTLVIDGGDTLWGAGRHSTSTPTNQYSLGLDS